MDTSEKKTILVVDDDREIVRAIALNLESEGYYVLKAYDGIEALDLAMTKEVHLIIIDVMMPKLDGALGHYEDPGTEEPAHHRALRQKARTATRSSACPWVPTTM